MATPVRVLAFDVNETLLDLGALDPHFEAAFGDVSVRRQWFSQMLQLAFVGAITNHYVDFTSAQHGALAMLAEGQGVDLLAGAAEDIVGAMHTLPAHPEVDEALTRLREGGFTLAALTNSPLDVAHDQLHNAELHHHFDRVLSADQVKALKPRAEPYEFVADTYGVGPAEVRLVAAHGWDIAGALAAGCRAAFVARPGAALNPLADRPDVVGADLGEVADGILRAG